MSKLKANFFKKIIFHWKVSLKNKFNFQVKASFKKTRNKVSFQKKKINFQVKASFQKNWRTFILKDNCDS